MSGLLAFMIMVSCSDGFKDCALARPPQAYSAPAACEADLGRALRRAAQGADNVLGRCAVAYARNGGAAETRFYWQVSRSGDLLAEVREPGRGQAQSGQLYAENISSQGAASADVRSVLGARDNAADSASGSARGGAMLSLYGNYKRGKPSGQADEPAEANPSLGGYSAKYIYETAPSANETAYAPARISVFSALSDADFTIRPQADEAAYSVSSAELAALRDAPLAADLHDGRPSWQRIFYRQNYNAAPALRDIEDGGAPNVAPQSPYPSEARLTYLS